jgi:hypothetical protein
MAYYLGLDGYARDRYSSPLDPEKPAAARKEASERNGAHKAERLNLALDLWKRRRPIAALDQLQQLAEQLRKVDPNLTEAQAFTKVYADPKNRDLVRQEHQERMPKVMKGVA